MELQPLVGASCAHCLTKILVDVDGKNCKRCGLAIHRKCSKDHRATCTNKPQVAAVEHDYDETAPFEWTPRLVTMLAIGAFILGLGLSMLTATPPDAPAGEAPAAMSTRTIALGWSAVLGGLALGVAGVVWERGRQKRIPAG